MVFHDRLPVGSELLINLGEFVRGNPLLSTAILGASVSGVTAGVVAIRRRKKKRTTTSRRRKRTRSKTARSKKKVRRRRVTHSSPRHRGHKIVKFRTKDGKTVRFKVKKPNHTHKRRRRSR